MKMITHYAVKHSPSRMFVMIATMLVLVKPTLAQSSDVDTLRPGNKRLFLGFGVGSIEVLNFIVSPRIYKTVYAEFSAGLAFVPGAIKGDGAFLKAGMSWRTFDLPVTPIITASGGAIKVGADNGPATTVISFLGGFEIRPTSGVYFQLRGGYRYCHRPNHGNEGKPGWQLALGFSQ